MSGLDLREIGGRIAGRRRQLAMTQEVLAEKMNVSVQMISNLERGNKAIRIDNLVRLSEILGVSCDYILIGRSSTVPSGTDNASELSESDAELVRTIINRLIEK